MFTRPGSLLPLSSNVSPTQALPLQQEGKGDVACIVNALVRGLRTKTTPWLVAHEPKPRPGSWLTNQNQRPDSKPWFVAHEPKSDPKRGTLRVLLTPWFVAYEPKPRPGSWLTNQNQRPGSKPWFVAYEPKSDPKSGTLRVLLMPWFVAHEPNSSITQRPVPETLLKKNLSSQEIALILQL